MGTNTTRHSVAATGRDAADAIDVLTRALSLNQLMFMAGESIKTDDVSEAITTGSDIMRDLIVEAKELIYAAIDGGRS